MSHQRKKQTNDDDICVNKLKLYFVILATEQQQQPLQQNIVYEI